MLIISTLRSRKNMKGEFKMEPTAQVRILAIVKLLNEVDVKGHDNFVRMATAINELNQVAKQLIETPAASSEPKVDAIQE